MSASTTWTVMSLLSMPVRRQEVLDVVDELLIGRLAARSIMPVRSSDAKRAPSRAAVSSDVLHGVDARQLEQPDDDRQQQRRHAANSTATAPRRATLSTSRAMRWPMLSSVHRDPRMTHSRQALGELELLVPHERLGVERHVFQETASAPGRCRCTALRPHHEQLPRLGSRRLQCGQRLRRRVGRGGDAAVSNDAGVLHVDRHLARRPRRRPASA